jgi:hypothetical protein
MTKMRVAALVFLVFSVFSGTHSRHLDDDIDKKSTGTTDTHTGTATAYSGDGEMDKTGKNACQFDELEGDWDTYYGAFSYKYFDMDKCGTCVRARSTDGGGDWTTLMIVDECASCEGEHDVDMSETAFTAATGLVWDMAPIEWEFVEC